jgi:hypothetical protein
VFQLVNHKFIVAADSRAIFKGQPNEHYCKIAAFRGQFVFAVSGGPSYTPGDALLDPAPAWDAIKEADAALLMNSSSQPLGFLTSNLDTATRVNAIADTWVRSMTLNWQLLYGLHPDIVKRFAEDEHGVLTIGIFAFAVGGTVSLTTRQIRFINGIIQSDAPNIVECSEHPCASGMTGIAAEYIFATSERAKNENWTASPEVLHWMGADMAHIIRIADLTVAYDKSGMVGGPIDALELAYDGSFRWIQRKDECPDDQDYRQQH